MIGLMMCQAVAVFVVGRERATYNSNLVTVVRFWQKSEHFRERRRKRKEKEKRKDDKRSKFEVAVILRHSS